MNGDYQYWLFYGKDFFAFIQQDEVCHVQPVPVVSYLHWDKPVSYFCVFVMQHMQQDLKPAVVCPWRY